MSLKHTLGRALLALALGSAAACSDATGPKTVTSIDTQGALTKIEPLAAVLDQPAFISLEGAGAYFDSYAATSISSIRSATRSLSEGRWDAGTARGAMTSLSVATRATVAANQGTTYVYDPATGSYAADQNATGAPAAGVRIVLYAWDQLADRPASPLTRVGYVDLIDESTGSSNVLRVRLVRDLGGVVLADYTLSNTVTATGETFAINGSANDGTNTLNFNLNGSTSGSFGAAKGTLTFSISAPSVGASVSATTSFEEATGRAELGVALGFDGHTLTFDLAATANGASGKVKFDGALYANYTATYDATTGTATERFVKADGTPLTAQELDQLQQIFERALDVSDFWSGLLWPIYVFQQ